ncbi:MAG: FxLYD domain-containing protein [Bacillota bacterium]
MKKVLVALLCLVMVLGFCACGGSSSSDGGAGEEGGGSEQAATYEVGDGTAITYEDSIGSKWVQVIVPVTNTGETDLYLDYGKIDLEDESGALVKTLDLVNPFPEILKPGETACYYEEEALDYEAGKSLTVVPHLEISDSTVEGIRFDVSETSISDQEYIGGVQVMGRMENNTEEDADMVYVAAILYDADGNILGVPYTISDTTLKAGEKMGFELTTLFAPESLTKDAVDHFEVFAYPSQIQE